MKRIRLVVIEDNRLLREGLTVLLREQPDITVVASLSNGEALIRARRLKPDVILLDIILRSGTSLRLVQSIKSVHPEAKIIVIDLAPIQPTLVDYVKAGVVGFVLKDATFKEFLGTIRDVARGRKVLPPILTSSLFTEIVAHATETRKGNPFKLIRMTGREREVIELIAEGLSNKQIAVRLNLAVDTIKSHVHNILEKLQLHTRLEIASYRHSRGSHSSTPHDDVASEGN
jgi:DNA-binding NarL/FixJ family response regulator